MKYRKRLAIGLMLLALVGAATWLVATTSGLRFIAQRALPHLPVAFEPGEISGRLIGPLAVGRIELNTPVASGTIDGIELDWRPAALLARTLHVRELRILAPRLIIEPPPSEPGAPDPQAAETAPFNLPLKIVLDHLSVSEGEIRHGGEIVVDGLQLELGARAAGDKFELLHLDIDSSRGQISGHAHASMAPGAPWDVDLAWRLSLEGGPFAGRTRILGRLADLAVEQRITAPLSARIEGTVRGLPAAPAWSLAVAVEPLPPESGLWPAALDAAAAQLRIEGRLEHSRVFGQLEVPAVLPGQVDIDADGGWANGVATLQRLAVALADGGKLDASARVAPGEPLSAEFTLTGERLGWPLEGTREVELPTLSLRGSGADDRWQLAVDGRALREGLPPADFEAALQWAGTLLTIERLVVTSPEGEINASANGTLETAGGQLEYRVALEADARLPGIPPVSARFTAAGNAHGMDIETLHARALDGTIDGAGRITWTDDQAAEFSLRFVDLDPSSLAPDWPGRLGGTLTLRGAPAGPDGLEIVLRSLRGDLRLLPVRGEATLNIAGSELLLRRAALSIGGSSLEASGRLGAETVTLQAALEAASLADLHPDARGSLSATTRIAGARAAPRVTLEARGADLGWQAWQADTLVVDADVDASGARLSRIEVVLDGIVDGQVPAASLRFEAEGTPEDHRASLLLDRSGMDQQFRVTLEGGVVDDGWSGLLRELSVAAAQAPIWALQQPAALRASAARITLGDACMDGTLGVLCMEADWRRGGAWHGRATLGQLDLGPLSEWAGTGVIASGVVTGQVIVAADDDRFRSLTGGLGLTDGRLSLAGTDEGTLLAWEGGALTLEGDEAEARTTLRLVLAEGDLVEGSLAIGWNAEDPPLEGRVEANFSRLQIIPELVPELADLEGRASLQGEVSGTLRAPVLVGRFEWLDGAAQLPTLGIRPSGITLIAEIKDDTLSFRADGRSGDGGFEADGSFDLAAEAFEGRATLVGENLLIANLPEVRLAASPDLRFHYTGRRLVIGGEVDIPFGRITGLAGPTAVRTSPDEVIVGIHAQAEADELSVTSRVRVTVGPDVQVQAVGLRGSIEGSILTVTEPQALPWGRGELRVVDGTFSAFGQQLAIEAGRLIYSGGPLENPGLEIRATRRVDNVTAGALVRGTLQQPEISVFSDPPMSQAETLSYLTLGRSLDTLQSGEMNMVNQAANSLALSGGGLIAKDLGRRLGFDDVAVTAADDDSGGAQVMISKHLGGGLYVSYGVGLFDAVNTLRLRYQINKRLSIEATSGEEAAADLFYTFERD
jgi:translocation and assembly module TamB